jgi:competence ComEA-like helix-hairpin-helix protein
MENRIIIIKKYILGGALLCAFFLAEISVFAYDQNNIYSALTDEIVDFYNFSFPDNKITEEEKQWLITGSIDEDIGERKLYHFYDPVYKKGFFGISSKDWGTKNGIQARYYNSQMLNFASIHKIVSEKDYSYQRALRDYASGDKKRAFIAFGHILHLLEDAGVPDYTRNDPNLLFLDKFNNKAGGSFYEYEVAKWNTGNLNIARTLFLRKEKPVILDNLESYFDEIANYSNNNFFSKNTINNKIYQNPKLLTIKKINLGNFELPFIVSKDEKGVDFPLALIQLKHGKVEFALYSKEIGSFILNGYWDRLSKQIVIHGAGALKLFLEEAEKEKNKYVAKQNLEQQSFWAQITSLFKFNNNISNSSNLSKTYLKSVPTISPIISDLVSVKTSKKASPTPSPFLSPTPSPLSLFLTPSPIISQSASLSLTPIPISPYLDQLTQLNKININTANKSELETLKGIGSTKAQSIIDYRLNNGPFQKIEDITKVNGIGEAIFDNIKDLITVGNVIPTSTPSPVVYVSGGNGSSGSSSPTPLQIPSPSPSPLPSLNPTPTPTSPPSPSPTPTPLPTPEIFTNFNPGDVVINEIAWMGTASTNGQFCEWIELRNMTNKELNLSGWKLYEQNEQNGSTLIISLKGNIAPSGYYLIERVTPSCPDAVPSVTADVSGSFGGNGLSNNGERLILKDASGVTIDEVDGSNQWKLNGDDIIIGDNTTKATAQKIMNNWITAPPTPRAENKAAPTSQVLNYKALGAVTDLVAFQNSSTITVTWTAPDSGNYPVASLSYDLRYLPTIFTQTSSASWWASATKVASSSLPSVATKGALQSASFNIDHEHEYETIYYLGLKLKVTNKTSPETVEEVIVEGDISNIAMVSFLKEN